MKPSTDSPVRCAPSTVERRTFIWKAGAALSATLASAAATTAVAESKRVADPAGDSASAQLTRLSHQLAMLEDANAIRQLHRAYGDALNHRLYADAAALFADTAQAHFDAGVFILDSTREQHVIEVAADRHTATARFSCLMKVEATLASSSPLVEMARQQGQGVMQWWEAGRYENSYVRSRDGWKIQQLHYRTLGRAAAPVR